MSAGTWECSHCGWPWPLASEPSELAECDNCGDDEFTFFPPLPEEQAKP